METERYERLVVVMAAMAAGDTAAMFALYREFGGHLAAFMRRELRRIGIEDPGPDEVDGMVIDACFALFDCGAAWNPAGGALPWTWAARRLTGVASTWVGQHADEFDAARMGVDSEDDRATALAAAADEPELDVLSRMAVGHDGCALVLAALERVASPRDQAIVLELRSQNATGDPSPALTVARRHDLSAEAVRQVACRVRARLGRLAAEEHRFAALAALPIVA